MFVLIYEQDGQNSFSLAKISFREKKARSSTLKHKFESQCSRGIRTLIWDETLYKAWSCII